MALRMKFSMLMSLSLYTLLRPHLQECGNPLGIMTYTNIYTRASAMEQIEPGTVEDIWVYIHICMYVCDEFNAAFAL